MKKTISIIALLILTGCDYQTTSEQNEALIRMGAAGVGAANRGDSYIEAMGQTYGRIKDANRQAQ